jgi:DNA polymerase-3 subunit gamma/tau
VAAPSNPVARPLSQLTDPAPAPQPNREPAPVIAPQEVPPVALAVPLPVTIALDTFDNTLWTTRFAEFGIGGVVGTIAAHCGFIQREGSTLRFVLDQQHASFFDPSHTQRVTDQLNRVFGAELRIDISVGEPGVETPAAYRERIKLERLAQARQLIAEDANVRLLREAFGAELDESSIEPVDD